MRGSELFLALPWLYLLLAARALLPLHITTLQAVFLLVTIIGAVGWVRPARLVRGVVLSARERGFVLAARGFGASAPYLIRRHILPLSGSVLLTQATVLIPQYILADVTLSFLRLGVGDRCRVSTCWPKPGSTIFWSGTPGCWLRAGNNSLLWAT